MNLIECTGLKFGYPGQTALACPDFTVGTGDYIHIAGPNGIGKTTLLRVLAGLLVPFAGRVVRAPELGRGAIGYVPQRSPLQDDFPATVWEVVLSGCQSLRGTRPFYRDSEKQLARAALRRFGIEDLAPRSYRELSGGQRQRALLARSMAIPRKVLLLDEPMIGLDPHAIKELKGCLEEMRSQGKTLLISTHIIDSVDMLWDRTIIMQKGTVRANVQRQELEQNAQTLEQLFFSVTEGLEEEQ